MRKMVFLIVLFFLVISLIRNVADYQRNISFYDQTKSNYTKALLENKQLKVNEQAGSSPFEIEKNLRNKQNLIRDNEIIVIVPPPSPSPTPFVRPKEPVFMQWMRLFF
ncbi:MAG: septum formation initiator family protein [bacterium]